MSDSLKFKRIIEEKINNEGIKLLCQIPISKEEFAFLLQEIKFKVCHIFLTTPADADIISSLALTQIAMRYYKDGNFWSYFKRALELDVPPAKQNYLGQVFKLTISKYNLFEIKGCSNYVENIKAHAFVPDNYLFQFFDFAYDFYENNLFGSFIKKD